MSSSLKWVVFVKVVSNVGVVLVNMVYTEGMVFVKVVSDVVVFVKVVSVGHVVQK